MKKFMKLAAIAAVLALFVSVTADAQQRGQGRGRGGAAGRLTAEGVSADSAYNLMMTGITLDATKKAAVMTLLTKFQTDYRALPPIQRGGGGGQMDSSMLAAFTARNEMVTKFRDEVKKQLTTEQGATFDTNFPAGGAGRRGGGGGN